jgi:cytochrome c peroxidase
MSSADLRHDSFTTRSSDSPRPRSPRAVARRMIFAGLITIVPNAMAQLPPVPAPPENPITESKRVLGKILFWDEQLSSDNTIACGTCHLPEFAGADRRLGLNPGADSTFGTLDDVVASPGVARADENGTYYADLIFGWNAQVTPRSAPQAIGAMYANQLFWDGRASSTFVDPETGQVSIANGGALESQAVAPLVNDVEMAHEDRSWNEITTKLAQVAPLRIASDIPADVAAVLAGDPSYGDLFATAFGDSTITAERIAFAIATYERTLVPDQTPWDAFVTGTNNALTPGQRAGWDFFRNAQCSICHAPPLFTDNSFRNIGLRPVAEDTGRQEVTGNPGDRGRFKVPSLRNVGLKRSFMHTGRLATIPDVLSFYIPAGGQVQFPDNQDPLVPPINIPPQVVPALVDFLENGLTDPRVAAGDFPFDRPTLYSERLRVVVDFEACFFGPGQTPAPAAPLSATECLDAFDEDADGDVDMHDFGTMQQTLLAS